MTAGLGRPMPFESQISQWRRIGIAAKDHASAVAAIAAIGHSFLVGPAKKTIAAVAAVTGLNHERNAINKHSLSLALLIISMSFPNVRHNSLANPSGRIRHVFWRTFACLPAGRSGIYGSPLKARCALFAGANAPVLIVGNFDVAYDYVCEHSSRRTAFAAYCAKYYS